MVAFYLWAGKVIEYSELGGLFCGYLKGENSESSVNNGCLAWEV